LLACESGCDYTPISDPPADATAEEIVMHATHVFEQARHCQIQCAALVRYVRARQ
jgi:hypothetical protein